MRTGVLRAAGYLYLMIMVLSLTRIVVSGFFGLSNWQPYVIALLTSLILPCMTVLYDLWTREDIRESTRWDLTQRLMFDVAAVVPAFNYLLAAEEER